jgi:hypothetical protein
MCGCGSGISETAALRKAAASSGDSCARPRGWMMLRNRPRAAFASVVFAGAEVLIGQGTGKFVSKREGKFCERLCASAALTFCESFRWQLVITNRAELRAPVSHPVHQGDVHTSIPQVALDFLQWCWSMRELGKLNQVHHVI